MISFRDWRLGFFSAVLIAFIVHGCGNNNTNNIVGPQVSEEFENILVTLKSDKDTVGNGSPVVFTCDAEATAAGGFFAEGEHNFMVTANGKLDPSSDKGTITVEAGETPAKIGFHFTETAIQTGTAQFTCTYGSISITKSISVE